MKIIASKSIMACMLFLFGVTLVSTGCESKQATGTVGGPGSAPAAMSKDKGTAAPAQTKAATAAAGQSVSTE